MFFRVLLLVGPLLPSFAFRRFRVPARQALPYRAVGPHPPGNDRRLRRALPAPRQGSAGKQHEALYIADPRTHAAAAAAGSEERRCCKLPLLRIRTCKAWHGMPVWGSSLEATCS